MTPTILLTYLYYYSARNYKVTYMCTTCYVWKKVFESRRITIQEKTAQNLWCYQYVGTDRGRYLVQMLKSILYSRSNKKPEAAPFDNYMFTFHLLLDFPRQASLNTITIWWYNKCIFQWIFWSWIAEYFIIWFPLRSLYCWNKLDIPIKN